MAAKKSMNGVKSTMKPGKKAKLALCMCIAALPWLVLVVLMATFGVTNVLVTIALMLVAIFVLIVVVLFVRACGLELYERVFDGNEHE